MKSEFIIDLVFRSKVTGKYYFGTKSLITGNYEIFIGTNPKGVDVGVTIPSFNRKITFKEMNLELVEHMITLEGVA